MVAKKKNPQTDGPETLAEMADLLREAADLMEESACEEYEGGPQLRAVGDEDCFDDEYDDVEDDFDDDFDDD